MTPVITFFFLDSCAHIKVLFPIVCVYVLCDVCVVAFFIQKKQQHMWWCLASSAMVKETWNLDSHTSRHWNQSIIRSKYEKHNDLDG